MPRGFQMWPQNLNRTTFEPLFGPKTIENWKNPVFDRFWPKRGSHAVWFKFWDQIWNPLVIPSLYDLTLLKLSNSEFLFPPCNRKISNGPCDQFFFEFEIFDVRFGISVPKDIKMNGVAIALTKMVLTTRLTVATARGTKLKPVQHSLVFREYNMSKRSSTGVNLQPIYEPISTYFFRILFCYSWRQEPNWPKNDIFRPQTLRPCQHEKSSN